MVTLSPGTFYKSRLLVSVVIVLENKNKIYLFFIAQSVKNLPAVQETQVQFLGLEDPLEKEMAIHSNILAWRIPFTEESGRLQSMGLQESDMT